jgi:coatomer protein complex subunit alpha (xenin)
MQMVAQTLGDPMLRFNTATLTANPAEKVKILAENGQIPLAYMTAKAHGLDEYIKPLETTIIESEEYDHERIFREAEKFVGAHQQRPKALLPLRPIFTSNQSIHTSQWPMTNLRAKEAERAA